MAGDWIKMRVDLADDPAVILIADRCGVEEDAIVGKLHRLWSWADRHTIDGAIPNITSAWVDKITKCQGFALAMSDAGWLRISDNGISFPNFEKHNNSGAKARSSTAERQARHRAKIKSNGSITERDVISRPLRRYVNERDDFTCAYCGEKIDTQSKRNVGRLSIDHIIPASIGGTTTATNLVTSCIECNNVKNDRTPEQAGMEIKFITELARNEIVTRDNRYENVTHALPREEKRREEKRKEESTIVDSCSEPGNPASEQNDDPAILTFPIKGKGPKSWHLRQSKVEEYAEAFPAVDILAECRIALQWCRDHPSKQKTSTGMAAFLSNWLSRQQNNPRQNYQRPPSTPPTADKILAPEVAPLTDEQRKMLDQIFERQRREHERKGLSADGPIPTA